MPNAGGEPRARAAARHERRLLRVGVSAMFGWGCSIGPQIGCPLPSDAETMVGLPEATTTPAPMPCAHLLDHLVSLKQQRRGDREPECLSGFEVDDQLEFYRPLHRQVRRLGAFENLVGV